MKHRRCLPIGWIYFSVIAFCCVPALPAATFVVTNAADSGPGSLRQAITSANSLPGPDAIQFNIPAGGVQTIMMASDLPPVTDALTIDGTTQPGFGGKPLIVLSPVAGRGTYGLFLLGGNCAVRGICVNGFASVGVLIYGTNNTIEGCFIGTDAEGLQARPNGIGVLVEAGSSQNLIGGSSATARNLISGNADLGICLFYSSGNTVHGNLIGTDATGSVRLGNEHDGISIDHSSGNNIGGTGAGEGNVISGNNKAGIRIIETPAYGNVIQGNLVGVDAAGSDPLGNSLGGIIVFNAPDNTIGGTEAGARNVVSGNTDSGIIIQEAGATGNVVEGNLIGVNLPGSSAVPNYSSGVYISNATDNTIGGTDPNSRNIISGNRLYGVSIGGTNNVVQGNLIGTDMNGIASVPNGGPSGGGGALISGANHTMGGDSVGDRNIVAGNHGNGITLSAAAGCVLQANWIGLDSAGKALSNSANGIMLSGGPGEHNVVSANGLNGIVMSGGATSGNVIIGNYVGLSPDGITARANGVAGIAITSGASLNLIGGVATGEGNRIAFNSGDGVVVQDVGTVGTTISGNSIFGNAGLCINLQPAGEPASTTTLNDPLDADDGPNRLQNSPAITNITHLPGATFVSGFVRSSADADFQIEVFSTGLYETSGFAEAQSYVGSVSVSTDSSGFAQFQFMAPADLNNQVFTATATGIDTGDTSELSSAFPRIIRITQIRRAGGNMQISFSTESGVSYRLEWTDRLPAVSWNTVSSASNVSGTGNVVTVIDPTANSRRTRHNVSTAFDNFRSSIAGFLLGVAAAHRGLVICSFQRPHVLCLVAHSIYEQDGIVVCRTGRPISGHGKESGGDIPECEAMV